MNCSNCGTQNANDAKFCIKCGNVLPTTNYFQAQTNIENMQQPSNNQNYINQNSNYTEPQPTEMVYKNTSTTKISISEYFFIILAVILKPFTAYKQEINKFNELKNSMILTIIISLAGTIVSLIKTMFSMVRVTSIWSDETKWIWENLKEINYIKTIGINFLIYFGIIITIAGVFYIGSLLIKKQTNFSRMLGISAISIVPALICSMIISLLLMMIYEPLGMIATLTGGIYTVLIIYEMMNTEIQIEGNAKLYFNLICMSVLIIAGYYLYMKITSGNSIDNVKNILDIFN